MDERILAIDDCKMNLDIFKRILGKHYQIETAAAGEAGLQKIATFRPHLVLLDIMMPGLNGYDVCRRIKSDSDGQFIQVILVSAKSSTDERLKGYECQADDFLVKPFHHDELLSKVRVQFRLWQAHRDLANAKRQLQLHNDNLEQKVLQRTRQVIAVRDVTVFALAQLAESRDTETGDHLKRIRYFCRILAEELKCRREFGDQVNEQFIDEIYLASPLHDVGKVGVPDHILQKPGKLTKEEFEIMKRHVQIGGDTLRQARDRAGGGFLNMAVDIALYHHERYDGAGYLAGLGGEDIPLAARIVALADVFDALSSARVYKPAFEPQKVLDLILEGRGTQFDARIVDAFIARHQEFLAAHTWATHSSHESVGDSLAIEKSSGEESSDESDLELGAIAATLSQNCRLRAELDQAQERLIQQSWDLKTQSMEARTDPLTRLPNRRAFDEMLSRQFDEFRQRGRPFSLIVGDVDEFKKLNDVHGHPAGDAVLRAIADLFRKTQRGVDFAARLGGDEFVFILPDADLAAAHGIAEGMRLAIQNAPVQIEGQQIAARFSFGVTRAEIDDTASALITRADQCLYQSKVHGRNCTSCFPTLSAPQEEPLRLSLHPRPPNNPLEIAFCSGT